MVEQRTNPVTPIFHGIKKPYLKRAVHTGGVCRNRTHYIRRYEENTFIRAKQTRETKIQSIIAYGRFHNDIKLFSYYT